MKPETPLAPGVWRITSNLDEDEPYEGLPIPHGLAIHAYLVRGAQTVVIDPYHAGEYGADEVAEDLELLGLGWADIDAVAFTGDDPGLTWPVTVLPRADTAELTFGEEMILHKSSGVLFSGAHWAGFGAVEDTVLSTEANGTEAAFYEDEALRWWVTQSPPPVCPAGVTFIAPGHGLLWPNFAAVVERARVWGTWTGPAEDEVVVLWSDDLGEDSRVLELMGALQKPGLGVSTFRIPQDHASFIRAALVRCSGVVLGPGVPVNLLDGLSKRVWQPVGGDVVAGAQVFLKALSA
jgi:flavorubredoxin